MRLAVLVGLILFVTGCSSKVSTPGTTGVGKYSEDISLLRKTDAVDSSKNSTPIKNPNAKKDPAVYVEARHAINQSVDVVLDSIDRYNLRQGVVDGFTIQLYSGVQRDEALNIKKQVATMLPNIDADLQFVQPNFRVRAGKYVSRVEAQKDYMTVKRYFPNAIVIPERIPIR